MNVEIRYEAVSDADTIDAVVTAAFLTAPHTSHTEQFIIKGLRTTGALTLSLVAEVDGSVIGHVAVSPITISDGASGWHGLGPISVVPACQKRGVGSRLVREALRVLRESGAAGCVVLGEPDFYGRFGFRNEPGLILPNIPPEYFQAITFGATAIPSGHVTYDDAFNLRA